MRAGALGIVLVIGTGAAAPAFGNWFAVFTGAGEGHIRHLGSAETPTPDDLRAIGDSDLGKGKTYRFDWRDGHYHEVKQTDDPPKPPEAVSTNAPVGDGTQPRAEAPAQ